MTNELKPFLEDMLSMSTGTDGRTLQIHFSRPVTMDDRLSMMNAHNAAVTRATPSANPLAGLVRYRLAYDKFVDEYQIVEHPEGVYVLHSEAAKVIDLMKHDEVSYRSTIEHLKQRAETAEAKQAKYENQLPIGYITPKAQLSLLQEFSTSDSISPVKMGECRIAIYDSPAPVSDSLNAEHINRELDGYIQHFREQTRIAPVHVTKALSELKNRLLSALKVEASND